MSIHWIDMVWKHAPVKGNALLCALAIADCANEKGEAWPGVTFLKKRCRVKATRNVQLYIRDLEAHNMLITELNAAPKYKNDDDRPGTNLYKLRPASQWKQTDQPIRDDPTITPTPDPTITPGVIPRSPKPSGEPSKEPSLISAPNGTAVPEVAIPIPQSNPATEKAEVTVTTSIGLGNGKEREKVPLKRERKSAPNSHAAMLDAFREGTGKAMQPPGGVAYGQFMPLMTRLEADGYMPASMQLAGELYQAWWVACGKPVISWHIKDMTQPIQGALQLCKMGKFPNEIAQIVVEQLATKYYRDNGIKAVKFETVCKLCRPTNTVRDAPISEHPGFVEDPERPGVWMKAAELRALVEMRQFAQNRSDALSRGETQP